MSVRRHRSNEGVRSRPAGGWIRLLLIVAVALPLAWVAGSQAAGMSLARFTPQLAVQVAPGNGEALARLAEVKLISAAQQNGGQFPPSLGEPLWDEAREAFLEAPLAAGAVYVAAVTRDAGGNEPLARDLMRGAVQLTKRDLATHLWLINDYGRTGNLKGLLHHYDLALRTSTKAPDLLLPQLALALQVPGAVDVLTPVMAGQPPWAPQFWRTAYITSATLPQAAELRLALFEQDISVPHDVDRRLILSLARDRKWDEAANLYRRLTGDKGLALDQIRDADLSRDPNLPPIEWNFPSSGRQSGQIDLGTRRMILSGGPSSSGVAAMRIVTLEPGRYELELERAEPETRTSPRLAVEIACVDSKPQRRIARFQGKDNTIKGSFETDASCRYYSVQIRLRTPSNSNSGQLIVEKVSLHPA